MTTHLEQVGDTWVERPGTLVARIHGQAADSAEPELLALTQKWGGGLPKGVTGGANRLNAIWHKLQGVRYHRDNYERREDQLLAKFTSGHAPPAGVAVVEKDAGLVFEVEAFLYQVKSTLDMLPRLLNTLGFHSMPHTFGDKGDAVVKTLTSFPVACVDEATILTKLIRDADGWLVETIATRDRIAHQGEDEFTAFIQEPYVGGGTAQLHYPSMPNGERARAYLARVEGELRRFVDAFVTVGLTATMKRRRD